MELKKLRLHIDGGTQTALVITAMAFFVRLCIAVFYENNYDTQWNLMWAEDIQNGFFTAYDGHVRQLDYPPLYLYVLKVVGLFTKNNAFYSFAPARMLAIKLFPVLCDSVICFLLYRIGKRKSEIAGLVCCALWAVNPAAVFNCSFWGQTDCVMLLALLVCFMLITQGRLTAGAIVYGLCVTLKFQTIYFAPVIALELIRRSGGFKTKKAYFEAVKYVAMAVGACALVWLPFCIGAKSITLPFDIYFGGADTYPYITLNADNIYGIFNFNWEPETVMSKILSIVSIIAIGVTLVLLYVKCSGFTPECAAILIADGIFIFTSRQHERYQMTVLIFLALFLAKHFEKRLMMITAAQFILTLFNQARVLALVNHGAEWANSINTLQTINSILNTALFMITVFYILKFTMRESVRYERFSRDRIKVQ